jgi:hypothetical protein
MFSFWGGMFGVPEDVRQEFYTALGRKPETIFPIEVAADREICGGVARALVQGFCRKIGDTVEVER